MALSNRLMPRPQIQLRNSIESPFLDKNAKRQSITAAKRRPRVLTRSCLKAKFLHHHFVNQDAGENHVRARFRQAGDFLALRPAAGSRSCFRCATTCSKLKVARSIFSRSKRSSFVRCARECSSCRRCRRAGFRRLHFSTRVRAAGGLRRAENFSASRGRR